MTIFVASKFDGECRNFERIYAPIFVATAADFLGAFYAIAGGFGKDFGNGQIAAFLRAFLKEIVVYFFAFEVIAESEKWRDFFCKQI